MENRTDWTELLALLERPAFVVIDGKVAGANQHALERLLPVGQDIGPLLRTGQAEYSRLGTGSLCLTLELGGQPQGAAVRRLRDGASLFLLDEQMDIASLRMLALAAQKLREPLTNLLNATDQLFPELTVTEEDGLLGQIAIINHSAYQLLRIVCNMSDGEPYLTGVVSNREPTDLGAYLEEVLSQCQPYCQALGVELDYRLPNGVACGVDRPRMERAIHNLLSNALRFTPAGGTIRVWVTQGPAQIAVHIQDSGEGLHQQVQQALFYRYRRAPAVEDSRYGVGLGLLLVRQIAALHGGALLVSPCAAGGTEAVLSMDKDPGNPTALHSPVGGVDYAGDRDHRLLELAQELPSGLFQAPWQC